jgi:hypothetical protein
VVAPWVQFDAIPSPPELPGTEEEVAAEWAAIIALTSEVLWALSGRRWAGPVTRTVEVVAPAAGEPAPRLYDVSWGTAMHPHVVDGQITNHSCCPAPLDVRLPGIPTEVQEVSYRGSIRDPGSYRLTGSYLQDLTGSGWPTCEPGIIVTYLDGKTPPLGGQRAAALLAKEFALARLGLPCGFPANIKSQTRQGITQTFATASELVEKGQTGVGPVDSWIATVNPGRLTRRARAWSPDTEPRTYRRTTP